jgi:carboxymethylenebutenolidase
VEGNDLGALSHRADRSRFRQTEENAMRRVIALTCIWSLALISTEASAQSKRRETLPRREGSTDLLKSSGAIDRLQSSPRHQEWVDIDSAKDRKLHTWVVYPQVDHAATVVIVIHENRGLTDWVRGLADQLAEAGYIAIAPDLLSGMAPKGGGTAEFGSQDKATGAIGRLRPEQVNADLDAVFKYAKELKAGNKMVAVGGFCWGGGKTFEYAAHNPKIAAAFVFYGVALKDEDDYKKIKAPVYGFYGGDDHRISGEVPDVEKSMRAAGKKYEPVIYKGAQHAFMRQGETAPTGNPNRKARDEAWQRWKKLLAGLK